MLYKVFTKSRIDFLNFLNNKAFLTDPTAKHRYWAKMGKFGTIAVIKRKSRTVFLLGKSTTQIFLLTDKEKKTRERFASL